MAVEKRLRDISELHLARRRARRRMALALAIFAVVVFVAFAVWLVRVSPYLRVAHVEVAGNKETPTEEIIRFLEDEIKARSWIHAFLGPTYIFLWRDGDVLANRQSLPRVKRIEISKDYSLRTVRVTVHERDPFGVWCRAGQAPPAIEASPVRDLVSNGASSSLDAAPVSSSRTCSWFDRDGILLGDAPLAEGNLIYAVHDYSSLDAAPAGRVLPEREMANLQSVFQVLQAADIPVSEIRLEDRTLQEIRVKTQGGPELYFSLRFPAEGALTVLKFLWGSGGAAPNLQYVDFRSENRAFYK